MDTQGQRDAQRLRDEGLTLAEIAGRLGYKSPSSAWKLLNPERNQERMRKDNAKRNEVKREWERRNRASCPECGQPMRAGSRSVSHRPTRCRKCRTLAERTNVDDRAQRIERWWAEGLKLREIGERLGWTEAHVGVEIGRLRAKGYDLRYRQPQRKYHFVEGGGASG